MTIYCRDEFQYGAVRWLKMFKFNNNNNEGEKIDKEDINLKLLPHFI